MTDAEARTLLTETLKMCVKEFATLAPFLTVAYVNSEGHRKGSRSGLPLSSILAAKTACNEVILKVEGDTDA